MSEIRFKLHELYIRYREPLRRGFRTFMQGAMGALVIYGNSYVQKEETDMRQLIGGAVVGGAIAVWQNRKEALEKSPSEEEQDAPPVEDQQPEVDEVDISDEEMNLEDEDIQGDESSFIDDTEDVDGL